MGNKQPKTRTFSQQPKEAEIKERNQKILFLGAADSGKSTLLNQIKFIENGDKDSEITTDMSDIVFNRLLSYLINYELIALEDNSHNSISVPFGAIPIKFFDYGNTYVMFVTINNEIYELDDLRHYSIFNFSKHFDCEPFKQDNKLLFSISDGVGNKYYILGWKEEENDNSIYYHFVYDPITEMESCSDLSVWHVKEKKNKKPTLRLFYSLKSNTSSSSGSMEDIRNLILNHYLNVKKGNNLNYESIVNFIDSFEARLSSNVFEQIKKLIFNLLKNNNSDTGSNQKKRMKGMKGEFNITIFQKNLSSLSNNSSFNGLEVDRFTGKAMSNSDFIDLINC
ncbi:hypothetical protein ABK040_015853, partial [Willaertia magna]